MPLFAVPNTCCIDSCQTPEYTANDPYPDVSPNDLRELLMPDCPTSPKSVNGLDSSLHSDNWNSAPKGCKGPIVKRSILFESSHNAQALRRKLIFGTNVLIVQGGFIDKKFVYDRLYELGVNVYILDDPTSVWANHAKAAATSIAGFIPVSICKSQDFVANIIEEVRHLYPDIVFHTVTTYYEDAVAIAARVAQALNVPGADVGACDRARSKHQTRQAMAADGLPVPRFSVLNSESDISAAIQVVGFPAVLKPSYGAASIGVMRVDTESELYKAFRNLRIQMEMDGDPLWIQGTDIVYEEYYDGDEFDIDVLMSNDVAVYAKVSDNWAVCEPWFQETGMHCPSSYCPKKQNELIDLAVAAVRTIGFKNGCLHVECRYTSRGPRLIEVNGRMGGDPVFDFNRLVWGVDLVEEHYMSVLGIPICPLTAPKPLLYVAEYAFNAPFSGIVDSDSWLDFLCKDSKVFRVKYFKRKGDKVVGPEDGVPDWLAEIIVFSHNSQEEVNNLIRHIVEKKVKVPIQPFQVGQNSPFFFPAESYPFS